ncbi:mechanosensitive ion channel [Pontibacter sp. KCTC 32443]|uniref:mechanosensitive ion channel family protein n=1 Tax=Pontibacter TaxID=323449 RepID=UPI00164E6B92|nr:MULTISPECIES: mechanosensitive ion channel domain-containing protein [Pontibacter]MBC5772659.1 mechanosensitive ion channel [Pontibacter sp. KCTC 32443]
MDQLRSYINHLDNLAISLMIIAISIILGLVLKYILFKLLGFYNRHSNPKLVVSFTKHLNHPLTYFIPLLFVSMAISTMPLSERSIHTLRRVIEILNIIVFAWILIKLVSVVQDMVHHKYVLDKADNLRERKLYTQLQFVRKVSVILIAFVAGSLILLQFEAVRTLGTGLLTSAGIAGVVLGFAAQRSLANLLAGLQIAFTQPIRIDDVLVIEQEFGRVEEITLTYVVLRIWDNRRLILPLNYFIEKPFQNWSRTSVDILATVTFYTDYNVPVDDIRNELKRLLEASPLWDKKVSALEVTEVLQETVQLRVLFSARNSGEAWDLRCHIREKLLYYIQKNYPDALPKVRTAVSGNISS